MRRNRIEFLLVGITGLALCAGVVAGMLVTRLPGASAKSALGPAASMSLSEQLQLTPRQRKQMRAIWEPIRDEIQQCFRQANDLQRQRDDEIVSILTDQQKAQFQKISKKYADKYAELDARREKTFQDAVERTRKILNHTQRAQYDKIIANRLPARATTQPIGAVPSTVMD